MPASTISSTQPSGQVAFRTLLANGTMLFLSLGMVAVKAIWDAQLLADTDHNAFIAFGFLFPLVITFGAVGMAISNAVTSTFSRWQWHQSIAKENGQPQPRHLDKRALLQVTLLAGGVGLITSVLMMLLLPLLIDVLNANDYAVWVKQFCYWFVFWQPVQFIAVSWQSVARGIGLYRMSALVSFSCQLVGMALSYWLLKENVFGLQSIEAIAISNLLTSVFIVVLLHFVVFVRLQPLPVNDMAFKMLFGSMGKVFYSGIFASTFALVFIFALTRFMAQQGEHVVAALTYVARIEQLFLIFSPRLYLQYCLK